MYCDYHRDKGHDKENCWTLKKEIEKVVKSGRLEHLVNTIIEGTSPILGMPINMVLWGEPGGMVRGKRASCSEELWMHQTMDELLVPSTGPVPYRTYTFGTGTYFSSNSVPVRGGTGTLPISTTLVPFT